MAESLVYFVRIGKKAIKIGFTTNLEERLKVFRGASAEQIKVIATFPGDRKLERRLHKLLKDGRITNEFFHFDWVLERLLSYTNVMTITEAIEQIEAWQNRRQPSRSEISRQAHARRRWDLEECIRESQARWLAKQERGKSVESEAKGS